MSQHGPDGSDVGIAFDMNEERGTVWVQPSRGEIVSVHVAARELAAIIRTLERWPLDLMDQIADADERKRRGHTPMVVAGELPERRIVAMWISTCCGHVEHASGPVVGIGDREECVRCELEGCEAVRSSVELVSLRGAIKRAVREPSPEPRLRVRRGSDHRLEYSDDGLTWAHAEEYARNAGLAPQQCGACGASLGACIAPCACLCSTSAADVKAGDVFLAMLEHERHWPPPAPDVTCSCDGSTHDSNH